MQNKILVLCSGGLDSTVLLHRAVSMVGPNNVLALNIFYGQKHAKEQQYAEMQCSKLGVKLLNTDLSKVFTFNPNCSALLQSSDQEISHESYAEQIANGGVNAYVPYRNGLFLSYAAAVALQLGCTELHYGAHADDAAGSAYPDCTPEFIEHQARAIFTGTGSKVHVQAPIWRSNKSEVVKMGLDLGMTREDFKHTWSCYEGQETPCGQCGTCRDRLKAFEDNGLTGLL